MGKEVRLNKWRHQMLLLKWSAIILPALFFVLIDLIWQVFSSDGPVTPLEFISVHVVIASGIIIISYLIFRFTSELQRKMTEQTSENIRDLAVTQERERIAREMHDGMAQVLGYINTQSIALRKLLSNRQFAEAGDELARMGETARELYSDVREGILGLRTASRQGDFLTVLREYVSGYSEMSNISVEITVSPDAEEAHLTQSAEIQLIRIAQEALTNVRKHSRVKTAEIAIGYADDKLLLTISDCGQGFDPSHLPQTGWPHFGLQTMQERAQAVGGACTIETAQGKGCRVSVCMPLADGHDRRMRS